MDHNAGRIRYDYVERLEKSINTFGKDLQASVSAVAESFKSVLRTPPHGTQHQITTLDLLDSVIANCARLVQ